MRNFCLSKKSLSFLTWLVLVIIIAASAWIRFTLIDAPLERDEGEYAYGGQLLLQGIPPYQMLYHMKLPGIYAAYAGVIAVFGSTHSAIHIGLIFLNVFSIILLFLIGRLAFGKFAGLTAASVFAVLSVGQPVQGIFANAEHFVIFPMLAGVVLVLLEQKRECLWLSAAAGIMFGIGFIIKQHGFLFIVWGLVFLLFHSFLTKPVKWRRLIYKIIFYSTGAILPYLVTCLLFLMAGVFDKFWFWTFEYPRSYVDQVPLALGLQKLKMTGLEIVGASPLIWIGVAAGLAAGLFFVKNWHRSLFVLSFTVFSFLAVCPGLFFRPHYFVFFLPAAALVFAFAMDTLFKLMTGFYNRLAQYGLVITLILICIFSALYNQRHFLFQMTPAQATRDTYGPNPFNESLKIAEFIKENSKEGDQIAILGSEPQIFFYSGHRSASGYIYMYPLMENHDFALQMQKEFIQEVEKNEPKFMIFVRIPISWFQEEDSQKLIFDWFVKYKKNYQRVGMIEIFKESSQYSWSPNIIWPPTSPFWIEVLKRKK